jgi:hypothetical protein
MSSARRILRKLNRDFSLELTGQIPIIMYSRESFQDVTLAPDWAGAIYDGKVRLPTGNLKRLTPAFERVLTHELAHALIHLKAGPNCPGWLHEGIAQAAEGKTFRSQWLRAGRPPPQALSEARDLSNPRLFYLRALGRYEFMKRRYGATSPMRLLDAIRKHQDFEIALKRALRVDRRRFEAEWEQWLRREAAAD